MKITGYNAGDLISPGVEMDEIREIVAKQRQTIEKNKALLRTRENTLNNQKLQQKNNNSTTMKNNIIVPELRDMKRQYSDKEAELAVATSRVSHLQNELEQIRSRKQRNGCSAARVNLLTEMRALRDKIKAKSGETDRQLCELRKQKESINIRRDQLKQRDDKINIIKQQLAMQDNHNNDRIPSKKSHSSINNTISKPQPIKKMPLYTAKPYTSGAGTVGVVKFARNETLKYGNNKNGAAKNIDYNKPPQNNSSFETLVKKPLNCNDEVDTKINNSKSKLRTLVESTRPTTEINIQDPTLSVDGALSILLPDFQKSKDADLVPNTLQTCRETMSQLYKDYNINNKTPPAVIPPFEEFHLLEDSVTSSVHNLTIEEPHNYSVEEATTTFDDNNMSDSFDQSHEFFSNEDDEYSSNSACVQIISDPSPIKIKGCMRRKNVKNTNSIRFDPLSLLLDASLEGELDVVMECVKTIPDASATNDEGITALHNAICAGHFDIMRFLIDFPCDINAPDSDGWTPLHCAASCNNLAMLRLLIENGAAVLSKTFNDNQTALEKCESNDIDFENCYKYLNDIETKLGVINRGIVYSVFNYEAMNDDELSFKINHKIQVLTRGTTNEPHWWKSKNLTTLKCGLAPCNLLGLYSRVTKKKKVPTATLR